MKPCAKRNKSTAVQRRVTGPAERMAASEADEVAAHGPKRKSEGDYHNDPLSPAQTVNPTHKPNLVTFTALTGIKLSLAQRSATARLSGCL